MQEPDSEKKLTNLMTRLASRTAGGHNRRSVPSLIARVKEVFANNRIFHSPIFLSPVTYGGRRSQAGWARVAA